MKLTLNQYVAALRECSHVERAHTVRHNGSYTNGQHSFDMMTLAYTLMPVVTRNIMLAIMFHDFPERWTGDMPGPAKSEDGEFSKRMAIIEARIAKKMGWVIELEEGERIWLKALDKLELLLWCHDQLHMGNQNVLTITGILAAWFSNNQVPTEVVDFVSNYEWTRTPDSLPR